MTRRVDFSADLILICNSLDAGGIERVVSTLANEWCRRGRKVCVITEYDRERFYELDEQVHHIVLQRSGLLKVVELPGKLKSKILGWRFFRMVLEERRGIFGSISAENLYQINFSLFFAHEARVLRRAIESVESPLVVSFGTSLNILTLKACDGLGRRVIVSERADGSLDGWGSLSRRFYGRAEMVTANSHGALSRLGTFLDKERLAFVPNPLVLRNGNGHKNGNGTTHAHLPAAPFFLTVARLVWDKGSDVLLEAFALLGSEFRDWRLAIVGAGHLELSLKEKATSLGIADRVDWLGLVKDPYILYRSASIFALPSRIEGMPNALLEAMGSGLPCVVSDGTPGPLELIEDGVTGMVVPIDNAAELAGALATLARNPKLRQRLGHAAAARSSAYEVDRSIKVWESVLGLT